MAVWGNIHLLLVVWFPRKGSPKYIAHGDSPNSPGLHVSKSCLIQVMHETSGKPTKHATSSKAPRPTTCDLVVTRILSLPTIQSSECPLQPPSQLGIHRQHSWKIQVQLPSPSFSQTACLQSPPPGVPLPVRTASLRRNSRVRTRGTARRADVRFDRLDSYCSHLEVIMHHYGGNTSSE